MNDILKLVVGESLDIRTAWRQSLFLIGICLITLALVYRSSFLEMVNLWWNTDEYTQGFFIFPTVFYLLWRRRDHFVNIRPEPSITGLCVTFGLVAVWMVGNAINFSVIKQLAIVAMIPAIIWTICGDRFARENAFPLSYILIAVPVGEIIIPYMQDITAAISVSLLRLTGIPVLQEGRFFLIPSGQFEIAKTCSGIRYLITSVTLGILYAYLMYSSIWRRLIFILLSIFVPVIANGLRAYGIVMIAHFIGYEYAVGIDHLIYGWIFFGIVIFFLFWLGGMLQDKKAKNRKKKNSIVATEDGKSYAIKQVKYFVVLIFLLSSGPTGASWFKDNRASANYATYKLPDLTAYKWIETKNSEIPWQPKFNGAAREYRVGYRKNNFSVQLYIAYYNRQNQGSELINADNSIYDKKLYKRIDGYNSELNYMNRKKLPIKVTIVRSDGEDRLIYYWYKIGDVSTTNAIYAKFLEAKNILFRNKKKSMIIMVSSSISDIGSINNTRNLLEDFCVAFASSE